MYGQYYAADDEDGDGGGNDGSELGGEGPAQQPVRVDGTELWGTQGGPAGQQQEQAAANPDYGRQGVGPADGQQDYFQGGHRG